MKLASPASTEWGLVFDEKDHWTFLSSLRPITKIFILFLSVSYTFERENMVTTRSMSDPFAIHAAVSKYKNLTKDWVLMEKEKNLCDIFKNLIIVYSFCGKTLEFFFLSLE